MNNKKKPSFEPNFDPTVPEEGVVVPEGAGMDELFDRHLPSEADIAIAARGAFGNILPEETILDLVCSSNEINESVRRIMHEHLNLGFRFGEIIRSVHHAYAAKFGDNPRTSQRAKHDALAYIEKLHRISNSKVRMHLSAYAKFHSNTEAIEFLRQTDMQLLLAKDLDDDIVTAVIEQRKANPEMSTREVKTLIAAYRHMREELTATREQVESGNNETARLNALYDVSKTEVLRLRHEMDRMQLQESENLEAMGRLRNDLALAGASRNGFHLQISEIERERDAARREVLEMRKRLPKLDDAEARAHRRRLDNHIGRQIAMCQQLDEQIDVRKAKLAAISATRREADVALETRSRVDEQMSELVADFCEVAQRYQRVQLLCNADDNPERYEPIVDALADVVGKFYTEIVAARKRALRYALGKRADARERDVQHEPEREKDEP